MEMLVYSLVGLYFLNVGIPVVLFLAGVWSNIALRTDVNWFGQWQDRKYHWYDVDVDDPSSTWGSFIIFDVIAAGVAMVITTNILYNVPPLLAVVALVTLASPFVFRIIRDIFVTLKMSYKTGDSERLRKLEEEIERINNRK